VTVALGVPDDAEGTAEVLRVLGRRPGPIDAVVVSPTPNDLCGIKGGDGVSYTR
jgi:hypothetical protein